MPYAETGSKVSRSHPVITRRPSTKMQGVWVRNIHTDAVGYISYAEIPVDPDEKPKLWVVYPPTPHNKEVANFKVYSAGSAYVEDLKRLKRPRKKVENFLF